MIQFKKVFFSSALIVSSSSLILGFNQTALADPTPGPPVFCFRFTDIKAVESDAEGDKFQVSFEVLNWSDKPAGGVRIVTNVGTNVFVQDIAPSFANASTDANGRPIGNGSDPLPGNQPFINDGGVAEKQKTFIQWGAVQKDGSMSGPIPNQDLIGAQSTGGIEAACELVPGGCMIQNGIATIPDKEKIDDGKNVLDGFVMTIDDLDEGEVISFNWNLLDVEGNLIGTPNSGNAYGFGIVNLARNTLNNPNASFIVFPELGNTGTSSDPQLFGAKSNEVLGANGEPIALFGAEFAAGVSAPVPEPSMMGASIFGVVGFLRSRRRKKK